MSACCVLLYVFCAVLALHSCEVVAVVQLDISQPGGDRAWRLRNIQTWPVYSIVGGNGQQDSQVDDLSCS